MKLIEIGDCVIETTEFVESNSSDYNAYCGGCIKKDVKEVSNCMIYIKEGGL